MSKPLDDGSPYFAGEGMKTFVVCCSMKFTKPSESWWRSGTNWSGIYIRLRKAETRQDAEALTLHSVRSEISGKHRDAISIDLEQIGSVELKALLQSEEP